MGIQALDGTTGNSNGHFPNSGSRVQGIDLTADKTYYMELKRESASKATFTIWSDKYDGTALSGFPVSNTSEVSSSLADLQYIKWQNRGHDGVRSGSLTAEIKNIEFYNGVTSTTKTSDIQTNAIFEESDTGKHYIFDGSSTWTEIA